MERYARKVVEQAQAWIDRKERNGSHQEIIDIYNAHKPLARGYKVKYTDAWCATFVSAVAIKLGYTDIIPTECGCEKMIALLKAKGAWVEDENRTPKAGDIIFYDWEDNGKGDNKGYADHVGIVESVDGSKITVIEGNYNDSVARRTIEVNGKYIRGYGVPKYDVEPVTPAAPKVETAEEVYVVKKGDILSKIANKFGTTVKKLAEYNGIANPNVIHVGQKIKIPSTKKAEPAPAKKDKVYTVKKGDSLIGIAAKHGTTYQALAKHNSISNPSRIYPGQKIKIPQ